MVNYLYFNQKYISNIPERHLDGALLLVPEPWLFFKNKLKQKICHFCLSPRINSRFSIPFRKKWIRKILECSFKEKDEICIIINSHFYHLFYSDIKDIAKSLYKKVYCVFIFSDKVEYFQNHYKDFPSLKSLKQYFNVVITYNIYDVEHYDLILDRPCFPFFGKIDNKLVDYKSDLFFVGSNKGRINELYRIFEYCDANGIKCDFHIIGVPKNEIKYENRICFNKPIPYSEVLERSSKTKCILYIVQDNGSGIVLRDYEALTFGKKILTNNKALTVTGLYSKQQVIWIDELEKRKMEILDEKPVSNSFSSEYSMGNWLNWLHKQILK